jgi:hypothetical protein
MSLSLQQNRIVLLLVPFHIKSGIISKPEYQASLATQGEEKALHGFIPSGCSSDLDVRVEQGATKMTLQKKIVYQGQEVLLKS